MATKTNAAVLVIGYTQSERPTHHDPALSQTRDYIPACDGWRAGARQILSRPILVELDGVATIDSVEDLLEGVFIATNAPIESARSDDRGRLAYDAMARADALKGRAVSKGDTIRVVWVQDEQITDGTYACESASWTLIAKGEL
jgi:hypothetical protein